MTSNVEYIVGDIFATELPAIGHGVNLDGVMGSGIAVLVRRNFPDIYEPYKQACRDQTLPVGGMLPINSEYGKWIFNLASQDRPGANARLNWLEASVEASFVFAERENIHGLALPRIGAGVGGLKWVDALASIQNVAARHAEIKLDIYSLPDAD